MMIISIDELNIEVRYFDNGKVRYVVELDSCGRYNGVYMSWHGCGKKSELGYYKQDSVDGLYTEWHPNGNVFRKIHYSRNKLHGLYQCWSTTGHLSDTRYHYQNANITELVDSIVKDIYNITESEKIAIALASGLIL